MFQQTPLTTAPHYDDFDVLPEDQIEEPNDVLDEAGWQALLLAVDEEEGEA